MYKRVVQFFVQLVYKTLFDHSIKMSTKLLNTLGPICSINSSRKNSSFIKRITVCCLVKLISSGRLCEQDQSLTRLKKEIHFLNIKLWKFINDLCKYLPVCVIFWIPWRENFHAHLQAVVMYRYINEMFLKTCVCVCKKDQESKHTGVEWKQKGTQN